MKSLVSGLFLMEDFLLLIQYHYLLLVSSEFLCSMAQFCKLCVFRHFFWIFPVYWHTVIHTSLQWSFLLCDISYNVSFWPLLLFICVLSLFLFSLCDVSSWLSTWLDWEIPRRLWSTLLGVSMRAFAEKLNWTGKILNVGGTIQSSGALME
jgi:hypothetical protein